MPSGGPKPNPAFGTCRTCAPLTGEHSLRETAFFVELRKKGLPLPVREYFFHPVRLWRFDYSWPQVGIAMEIEGGVSKHYRSRHTESEGYLEDMRKYTEAGARGWVVLRFTWKQLQEADTLSLLQQAFDYRADHPHSFTPPVPV